MTKDYFKGFLPGIIILIVLNIIYYMIFKSYPVITFHRIIIVSLTLILYYGYQHFRNTHFKDEDKN